MGGLAHLTRSDAVLIVPTLFVSYLWARRRGSAPRLSCLLYFVIPYALVVAPWLVRNHLVFGGAFRLGAGKLILMTDYYDLFRLHLEDLTIARLFATQSITQLTMFRVTALIMMLVWIARIVHIGLVYLPFQAWRERLTDQVPFIVHWAVLTGTYWLLLPHIGIRGSYPRACAGLFAYFAAATAGGLFRQIGLLRRAGSAARHTWRPTAAVGVLLVALVYHLLGWLPDHVFDVATHPYYANRAHLEALAPQFGKGPLISDDPWRLEEFTEAPCYAVPTDGPMALLELAGRVGAPYLVIKGKVAHRIGLTSGQLERLPPEVPRPEVCARFDAPRDGGLLVYRLPQVRSARSEAE